LPLLVFVTYAYLGGVLWSGSFITLGYVLGDEWEQMSASIHRYLVLGAALAAVVLVLGLLLMRRRQRKRQAETLQAPGGRQRENRLRS
jgi:membrane protein DedA with SNARE-associated domain